MSDNSAIEWTDATWNPIRARNLKTGKVGWHCEHLTTGCEFCYAEGFNKRLGTGLPFKPGHLKGIERFLDEKMLMQPLRWKKPRMIFVCSMTDLFADFVPVEWIDLIFAVMALCPQHTFQVLTKRAARMQDYLSDPLRHNSIELAAEKVVRGPEHFGGKHVLPALPLKNVWLGVSTERQQEANERIPLLLQTPAAVRFISAEPLLGPIDLTDLDCGNEIRWNSLGGGGRQGGLDWVIVGGESGPSARPMHPDWARSLRDQCTVAGVPFFYKQWGNWHPEIDRDKDDPDWRQPYSKYREPNFRILNLAGGTGFHGERVHVMRHCSKKSAGRLLDGITHNGMPEVRR